MKKLIVIFMAALFLISAAACSEKTPAASPYTVSLNRSEANLEEGENVELNATVAENGEAVEASVTWKSSDLSVATVQEGVVTAVGVGTATVSAEYEGASAACVVNVSKYYEPQMHVELNYSEIRFTESGQTAQLTARALIGEEEQAVRAVFSSSAPEIASVSAEGLVTAVSEGSAEIYAKAEAGGYYAESVCRVSVAWFEESTEVETAEKYYIYDWSPERSGGISFTENVIRVRDIETGSELPYEYADGQVKILSGNGLFGERKIAVDGERLSLIATGIFVSGEIRTAEDLVSMMNGNNNQYLVLADDVDMSDYLKAHPWNSTDTATGAFFNRAFAGTLDGQGYSILNLTSSAGLIPRYTNTVFKEISAGGTIKNLHMQISIGLSGGEGARMGLLFGDMYGTIDNCFFEVNAQFNVNWYMYGAAPIYNLADTSKVTDTVFFIPNAAGLRMICSTSWGGDFEGLGVFENVAFVYGDSGVNNSLPNKYNPSISDIYVVRADGAAGEFNDAKVLNSEKYAAAGTGGNTNDPAYWDPTTLEEISAAMPGFVFTESTLGYGDKIIVDYNEQIEITDAYELAEGLSAKPWGNFVLMNDIDMREYLEENPWNWGTGANNTDIRALFNETFSGTLDGQGHSILNVTSSAGIIERWENVLFREISSTGVIKNVHIQLTLGIKSAGAWDRALMFGNMYGTLENCFFEIHAETDASSGYSGTAAIYRVSDTSIVKNTVFYIPEPAGFRLMCASTAESKQGVFENVAYVYGAFDYANLLPAAVNPDISGIYLIAEKDGSFTDAKALAGDYASGSTANGETLWEGTSLSAITAAMEGFTFTNESLSFGETVIRSLETA